MKKILLITGGLVFLLISYHFCVQIYEGIKAGDKLAQSVDKLYSLEVKNKELKSKLSEVKSPEFIERSARDKLGLTKEGETVVVIPMQVLERVLGVEREEEVKLPNPLGWLKLFLK